MKATRMEIYRVMNFVNNYYRSHIWPKWIKAWKDYLLNTIDRQLEIQDFQSNMKVPITRQYVNALWKSVYDNTIDFRVSGRTKQDHNKAAAEKNFLDWAFSRSHARLKLLQAGLEALIIGNAYVRTGFRNNKKDINYYKDLKKVSKTVTETYPYLTYESVFDIMIDPTAENVEESRYVINRKIMYKDKIIARYKPFIPDIEEQIGAAAQRPFRFWNYDFSRVKYLAFFNQTQIDEFTVGRINSVHGQSTDELDVYYKNYLTINYEGGYSEVIEYWEDNRLVVLVDGKIVIVTGKQIGRAHV